MSTQQFGGWLKQAREARGLTVEAIASHTKIPPRHIHALERGDALQLPAFYQRAEVRAVARVVGVDEQLAVARLNAELAPVVEQVPVRSCGSLDPPTVDPPEAEPRNVTSNFVFALLAMVVAVIGLAGWSSFGRTAASEGAVKTPAPITAPVAAAVAPLPSETPVVAAVEEITASDAAVVAPVGPTELVIRTQPEGARVTVNGIGWGAAPVTIKHLEPGEKRVRVTMDGYAATERSVTVDEGARATLRIPLSPVNPGT